MNEHDELSQEELTRVSNALDALQNHNNQPTTHAWEAIMEESNKNTRRARRRTQIISVAAAAALVVAIAGVSLIVTSQQDAANIKTVDSNKKRTVETSKQTTTTAPSTTEPAKTRLSLNDDLLQNTYLADATWRSDNTISAITIKDQSNKKMISVPNNETESGYPVDLKLHKYSAGHLLVNRYIQCDVPFGFVDVDLASGQHRETGLAYRTYSPDTKQYVEIESNCDTDARVSIVDTQTGKRRELKAESMGGITSVINYCVWINNSQFVYSITGDSALRLADTTKTISFSNDTIIFPDEGRDAIPLDSIEQNGIVYLLVYVAHEGPNEIRSVDISSGKSMWSIFGSEEWNVYGGSFGLQYLSPTRIVGSVYAEDKKNAFAYDQESNMTVREFGLAFIPKR